MRCKELGRIWLQSFLLAAFDHVEGILPMLLCGFWGVLGVKKSMDIIRVMSINVQRSATKAMKVPKIGVFYRQK